MCKQSAWICCCKKYALSYLLGIYAVSPTCSYLKITRQLPAYPIAHWPDVKVVHKKIPYASCVMSHFEGLFWFMKWLDCTLPSKPRVASTRVINELKKGTDTVGFVYASWTTAWWHRHQRTRHAHSLIKCVEAPKCISNVTGAHETGSQVMRKWCRASLSHVIQQCLSALSLYCKAVMCLRVLEMLCVD